MRIELIKRLGVGAFVGCFVVMLVMVFISLQFGHQNVKFAGTDIINGFLGSIVVGWGFSLSGLIYEREDIAFPLQVIFQMGIGMSILLLVATYLKWIPIELGWGPIICWILMACVFAAVFWFGFYIYYYLVARDLTNKIKNS